MVILIFVELSDDDKRNVVKNKLKLDTTSIIQNDYKLKLLKILKTQDKKDGTKISDNYC